VATACCHASRLSPNLLRVLEITEVRQRFSGGANPAALRVASALKSCSTSDRRSGPLLVDGVLTT
jgi:hypothetical protein